MTDPTLRNRHMPLEHHFGELPAALVEISSALSVNIPAGTTLQAAIVIINDRITRMENADIRLGWFRADAWIKGREFTADAILLRSWASSVSADAVLLKSFSGSVAADAIALASITGSFDADAEIVDSGTVFGSFTADAVTKASATGSFSADARISDGTETTQSTLGDMTLGDNTLGG